MISIGNISFDENKAKEWKENNIITKEGELARLYLEMLPKPARTTTGIFGEVINHPAKKGIDIETATFTELKDYLDGSIKKSESTRELCRKVMRLKYNGEYQSEKNRVSQHLRKEYQLINDESKKRNTNSKRIDFLGECGGGILGEVRLDGSTRGRNK